MSAPHTHNDHDHQHHDHHHRRDDALDSTSAARDPVCGMTVNPLTAQHKAAYEGTSYYFCSENCRSKFTAEPTKYLGK